MPNVRNQLTTENAAAIASHQAKWNNTVLLQIAPPPLNANDPFREPTFMDGYMHFLLNGNDNPVDIWDHLLNIGEGAAIGVATTAGVTVIALTFPVTAPIIFYGGIFLTGIGFKNYISQFGTLSTGQHERFWGNVLGSVATGCWIYFNAPQFHYTTAENAVAIRGNEIKAPVWSTNIPPEIMMHPIAGPFFKIWIGWIGPFKTGPFGRYPLTDFFPVPNGRPWLLFQFWSDHPVSFPPQL